MCPSLKTPGGVSLSNGFTADLPFLRDTVDVSRRSQEMLSNSSRKLTPGTTPRQRVDAEANRIFNMSDTLAKVDTGKNNASVQVFSGINKGGTLLLNCTYGPTFVSAMYNNTSSATAEAVAIPGTTAAGDGSTDP